MEEDNIADVTATLWNSVHEFRGGVELSYEVGEEFDEDKHYAFVDRLVEHHPAVFRVASEGLDDGMISVATIKPEQMHFNEECRICGEEIEKDRPHIERMAESSFEFICMDCFFKAPYMDENPYSG